MSARRTSPGTFFLIDWLKAGIVTTLDVRPEDEFSLGHRPGAFNISIGDLKKRLTDLDPKIEIVAYCKVGAPFTLEKDPTIKRETLEFIRAYYKIRGARVRKRILPEKLDHRGQLAVLGLADDLAADFLLGDQTDADQAAEMKGQGGRRDA